MSVGLFPEATDEQRIMADSVTRVIESQCPLPAVRALAEGPGTSAGQLWRSLAELGCFRLLVSEEHGGGTLSGNGLADAALLAAERGARLQPGPFVATLIVAGTLSAAATEPHRATLEALASGAATAAWAPDGIFSRPGLTVGEAAGGLTLSGVVPAVQDADECDWILVSTPAGGMTRQFLLPRSAAGLSLARTGGLDITRRFFDLRLDDVLVPAGALPGDPAMASGLADWQVAAAAVLSAAESVGAMHANFNLALEYSKTRVAFGRPIGSFQALKHLLASTSLLLEMSKGVVAGAAEALGGNAADGPAMASIARAFVSEHAVELTHNCFQVFGGIGYTWEHDQHLYMRRLAAEAYQFGSPAWHRQRIWQLADATKETANA